jgi:hypothetical protein
MNPKAAKFVPLALSLLILKPLLAQVTRRLRRKLPSCRLIPFLCPKSHFFARNPDSGDGIERALFTL